MFVGVTGTCDPTKQGSFVTGAWGRGRVQVSWLLACQTVWSKIHLMQYIQPFPPECWSLRCLRLYYEQWNSLILYYGIAIILSITTVPRNLHRFHDQLMCLLMCQGMGLRLLASPLLHEPLTKHLGVLGRSCRILVFDRFWINIWDTKRGYAKHEDETASWSYGTQIVKNKFCCMRDNLCTGFICMYSIA